MRKKIFVIVNQGGHPIKGKIKKLYGEDADIRTIQEGFQVLSQIAIKDFALTVLNFLVKNKIKYNNHEVFIVWSGLPLYNIVTYNVIRDQFGDDPGILIYNKDIGEEGNYEEYQIDTGSLFESEI